MISIGITGGAASGKSTVCRWLAEGLELPVLGADAIVAELLRADPRVHEALTARFGSSILGESGIIRAQLRERVFSAPEERRYLESVLHPLVRETWRSAQERDRAAGRPYFLVEIPLLFETRAQAVLDVVVCVTSSPAVQVARLHGTRGLSEEVAKGILAAQLSNEQRIAESHLVIWNDGSLEALRAQSDLALAALKRWTPIPSTIPAPGTAVS
jgi:dephospho-CoA kinase